MSFDVDLTVEEMEAASILLFSNNLLFKEIIPKHSKKKISKSYIRLLCFDLKTCAEFWIIATKYPLTNIFLAKKI